MSPHEASADIENPSPAQAAAISPLPHDQQRVLDVLFGAKKPIHIDTLSAMTGLSVSDLHLPLTYLEFDNLIKSEGTRYAANQSQIAYLRAQSRAQEPTALQAIEKGVAEFIEFCERHFHGTSRKYLQLYLAHFARVETTAESSFDSMMRSLAKHGPVTGGEIMNYVSPQSVLLLLQAA